MDLITFPLSRPAVGSRAHWTARASCVRNAHPPSLQTKEVPNGGWGAPQSVNPADLTWCLSTLHLPSWASLKSGLDDWPPRIWGWILVSFLQIFPLRSASTSCLQTPSPNKNKTPRSSGSGLIHGLAPGGASPPRTPSPSAINKPPVPRNSRRFPTVVQPAAQAPDHWSLGPRVQTTTVQAGGCLPQGQQRHTYSGQGPAGLWAGGCYYWQYLWVGDGRQGVQTKWPQGKGRGLGFSTEPWIYYRDRHSRRVAASFVSVQGVPAIPFHLGGCFTFTFNF